MVPDGLFGPGWEGLFPGPKKKSGIASACRGVLLVVPDGLFGPGWEGLFPGPKKNSA